MSEEAPPDVEQLMRDFVDLHDGDDSKRDVVSESFTFHAPGLPEEGIRGRDAWYGDYLQTFRDGFSDFETAINDLLVGDDLVMGEFTVTGTHDGEFQGIPPTDREVEIKSMSKFAISDGKVQEQWGYLDRQSLMSQLGVTDE